MCLISTTVFDSFKIGVIVLRKYNKLATSPAGCCSLQINNASALGFVSVPGWFCDSALGGKNICINKFSIRNALVKIPELWRNSCLDALHNAESDCLLSGMSVAEQRRLEAYNFIAQQITLYFFESNLSLKHGLCQNYKYLSSFYRD